MDAMSNTTRLIHLVVKSIEFLKLWLKFILLFNIWDTQIQVSYPKEICHN
jgi:hypothetical protein